MVTIIHNFDRIIKAALERHRKAERHDRAAIYHSH